VWVDPDLESLNDFYVIRYAQIGRKTDMDEMITTMDSVGLDSYLPWEEKVGEWCLKLHERDPKWYCILISSMQNSLLVFVNILLLPSVL